MQAQREALVRTGRVWLYRNSVGFDSRLNIPYGLGKGSPDLVGGLVGTGRWFCIETKSATGVESPEQLAWRSVHRRRGAFVATARTVEQALAALDRALAGARE
jgi:hypothetical protein